MASFPDDRETAPVAAPFGRPSLAYENLLVDVRDGIGFVTVHRQRSATRSTRPRSTSSTARSRSWPPTRGPRRRAERAGDKAFVAGADVEALSRLDADQARAPLRARATGVRPHRVARQAGRRRRQRLRPRRRLRARPRLPPPPRLRDGVVRHPRGHARPRLRLRGDAAAAPPRRQGAARSSCCSPAAGSTPRRRCGSAREPRGGAGASLLAEAEALARAMAATRRSRCARRSRRSTAASTVRSPRRRKARRRCSARWPPPRTRGRGRGPSWRSGRPASPGDEAGRRREPPHRRAGCASPSCARSSTAR